MVTQATPKHWSEHDYMRNAKAAANIPTPPETLLIEFATAALPESDGVAAEPEVDVLDDGVVLVEEEPES